MLQTHQLVNLKEYLTRSKFDICYATSENFLGFPVYSKPLCYIHQEALNALLKIEEDFYNDGFYLKIFDGYRPLHVQQIMWDHVQDERYISNPAKSKGRHTRGTAIDLTLMDQVGKELLMPSKFDEFSEKAHCNYAGANAKAISNREYLIEIMSRHKFSPYEYEWWHFDLDGWQDDQRYPPLDIAFEELSKFN